MRRNPALTIMALSLWPWTPSRSFFMTEFVDSATALCSSPCAAIAKRFFVLPHYRVHAHSKFCGATGSIPLKITPSSWSSTTIPRTSSFFSVLRPRSSWSVTVPRRGRSWLALPHESRARFAMRSIAASPATAIVSLAVTILVPCPIRPCGSDFLTWNPEATVSGAELRPADGAGSRFSNLWA